MPIEPFYPGLLKLHGKPMKDLHAGIFLQLLDASKKRAIPDKKLEDARFYQQWFRIIEARLAMFHADGRIKRTPAERKNLKDRPPVDGWLILFLTMICDGPSEAILWSYTAWLLWRREPNYPVTMETFAYEYPSRLPNQQQIHDRWVQQRQGQTNMLDDPVNWPMDLPDVWK